MSLTDKGARTGKWIRFWLPFLCRVALLACKQCSSTERLHAGEHAFRSRVAVFSIERWPASGAGPVSVEEAREERYRASNQAIRHDGARHGHDQQLANVELPQNEELGCGALLPQDPRPEIGARRSSDPSVIRTAL